MTPRTVFRICFGVNLHFTNEKYSIIKYGNDTSVANAKYDSLTDNQKYRFSYLADKYQINTDLMYACIGCQFDDVSIQHDIKSDVHESYLKFKSRREAMTHHLKGEISKFEDFPNKSLDKVIFKYFTSEMSPEFMLILDRDAHLLEIYKNPNFVWAKQKILRLIKYKDFFNVKKYQELLHVDVV